MFNPKKQICEDFEVFFTFLEIYNEKIIDLLDRDNMEKKVDFLKELTIFPASEGIVKVRDLNIVKFSNVENVFDNYLRGSYIRKVF